MPFFRPYVIQSRGRVYGILPPVAIEIFKSLLLLHSATTINNGLYRLILRLQKCLIIQHRTAAPRTVQCTASAAGQDRCQDQASTSNSKQYFANNPPPIQPASVHPSGNNRSHSSLEQASSDDEFRRKTNVHPTRIPFPYSLSTCRVISEFTTTTTSFHSDFR